MPPVYIGLDAGGTKTLLRCQDPARPELPDIVGPGVNLQRDGLDASATALATLIHPALQPDPRSIGAVCAGVSGAGREEEQAALTSAILARLGLPDLPLVVTHDAEIALEAVFGTGSGVIVIAGTGSVVYGRTETGGFVRAGGWGARLGDGGSGTAIGRAAARAVSHAFDGGPPTRLTAALAGQLGLHSGADLIHWLYRDHGDLARLAPLVLQAAATDPIADAILRAESDQLLQDARRLASSAGGTLHTRLACMGGVAGEPVYRAYLNTALRRHLPRWQAVETTAEPVSGAVRRARRWAESRER